MKKIIVPLVGVFLMAALLSCAGKKEAERTTESDVQGKVLATVNGVPITEYDVKLNLGRVAHGGTVPPEATQSVLQTLVRNELVYQQSLELGLDNNLEYRRKLYEANAQLRDYKRKEMSALFREYARAKAEVTDSEAREYFEKNSSRIRTKVHLWQIYYRGEEARIAEDHKELKSGKPFEKVASKRFPSLPGGMKSPWDLGSLHWSQIPAFWLESIDRLRPGEVSEILRGPNERFWVIKLIDRKADPDITFATEKESIVEILRKRKAEEFSESLLDRMRTKSKILFPK